MVLMRAWAIAAFVVVVLALIGYLSINMAFIAVIGLSVIGIFILRISSVVPMLQFALSLLILITLSGGVSPFITAVMFGG